MSETLRTDKLREAEKTASGPFEIAKVLNWTLNSHEQLERSLARRDALLRGIRDKVKLSSTHHVYISDEELAQIERVLGEGKS